MAAPITPVDVLVREAVEIFKKQYNTTPEVCACAPGRVNLIGEHTDYNGGFVFPMALPLVTVMVGKKTGSGICRVTSSEDAGDQFIRTEFQLPTESCPLTPGKPAWANYIKGVMAHFKGPLVSFDLAIHTSVPLGGGLSSSAAIEVAMYTFLEGITGNKSSLIDKALACQKAEHTFPMMPCGIMDQFTSTMGKEGNALLIDCRSNESVLVPLDDPELVILVTNSNVKHRLTGSEYPSRRKDCEEAAKVLGKEYLRDASMQDVEANKSNLSSVQYQRARHVVSEIKRTQDAVAALKNRDYQQFGKLMMESHNSLRDDFGVSCAELDQLVELATSVDGVFGSRMTGGGFGGCTVTLLKKDVVDKVISHVKTNYKGRPTFFVVRPYDGAKLLSLP